MKTEGTISRTGRKRRLRTSILPRHHRYQVSREKGRTKFQGPERRLGLQGLEGRTGLLESVPGLGTWLRLIPGAAHTGGAAPSVETLPSLAPRIVQVR